VAAPKPVPESGREIRIAPMAASSSTLRLSLIKIPMHPPSLPPTPGGVRWRGRKRGVGGRRLPRYINLSWIREWEQCVWGEGAVCRATNGDMFERGFWRRARRRRRRRTGLFAICEEEEEEEERGVKTRWKALLAIKNARGGCGVPGEEEERGVRLGGRAGERERPLVARGKASCCSRKGLLLLEVEAPESRPSGEGKKP